MNRKHILIAAFGLTLLQSQMVQAVKVSHTLCSGHARCEYILDDKTVVNLNEESRKRMTQAIATTPLKRSGKQISGDAIINGQVVHLEFITKLINFNK